LRRNGVKTHFRMTRHAGEIADILSDECGYEAVAIHGGDGTIREAVAALHHLAGARPALIVIPGGTANVLACELCLPHRVDEIVDLILAGRNRPLYYALANGKPFFLMASAGIDAAVVHGVSPRAKRKFGRWAFIAAAISILRRDPTSDVIIESAEKAHRARLAIVSNAACLRWPSPPGSDDIGR
jgi:diacylglycerol kinase (ATP)